MPRAAGALTSAAGALPHALGALLFVLACGRSPAEPPDHSPAAIVVTGAAQRSAVVATSTPAVVIVTDAAGSPVSGATVTYTITAGGGWVSRARVQTDAAGRAETAWYVGTSAGEAQQLTASIGSLSAGFTATAQPLEDGATYTGALGWVELRAGDLPIIISAPHGGTLVPSSIADRTGPDATTVRDANTELLAAEMPTAFEANAGGSPHVIILHLHRRKLDANRDLAEAAEGDTAAERAWHEYHGFIEAARRQIAAQHGRGVYIDLHGHGHAIQRLELGYLLSATDLAGDDTHLNTTAVVRRSSLRTLAEKGATPHAEFIRGVGSLGTLLEQAGYPAVPSAAQRDPGGQPYFTGGYSTGRHGSVDSGPIDGVQIEANMTGVRDTSANRTAFAGALALVMRTWLDAHYGAGAITGVTGMPTSR